MAASESSTEVIKLSRNPVKLFIWLFIAGFGIWFIAHTVITLLIFTLAILMAYLISPAVEGLSKIKIPGTRWKIGWGLSTLLVYVVIVALLVLVFSILVPMIAAQMSALASSMPNYIKKLEDAFQHLRDWYGRLHISSPAEQNLKKYAEPLLQRMSTTFSDLAGWIANGFLKIAQVILITLIALLFSVFIVLEQTNIKKSLFEMFPAAWHKDTEALFANVNKVVGVFIRGQIIMCIIVALGTFLVLTILNALGVPYGYSVLTAVFTGLLYPIPFIGFWIPRLVPPVIAFAQTGDWTSAFWVLLGLVSWGTVADNFILPFVMGRGIGISPLMVLVVVFAGGELFGIWGLILSIPAAAILRLIFFYLQKHVTI